MIFDDKTLAAVIPGCVPESRLGVISLVSVSQVSQSFWSRTAGASTSIDTSLYSSSLAFPTVQTHPRTSLIFHPLFCQWCHSWLQWYAFRLGRCCSYEPMSKT